MKQSPLQRFWNLLKLYKIELRQIYAYAIFIGIVNLSLPLGIQAIINYIQTGEMTSSWVVLVGFVLIGIAITGILQVLQLRVVENIQQDLFARSAFEFAYRIPKIQFIELDRVHAPELVNRFFDTLNIQKGLPKILIDFSLAAFQIIFGLVLLSIYSAYFIILGFLLVGILFLIFQLTGKKGLDTSLKESKYKYNLAHWLEEVGRMNRSFKMNTTSRYHLNRTDEITVNYLTSREKHFLVLINQFRFFIAFKVLVAAGLLILGSFLVFTNQMDIGQFVASEIIIILIINSVEKILRVIETIYDTLTGLEKIGYVTDLKLDENKGVATIEKEGGIELKANELAFGYPNDRQNVFEDLSFHIPANAKVVVKGKSGSGKSTLLQVIAGIHKFPEGELYFNGIPFNNFNREQLYPHIGMAFPTNQLFEGSILENITLGRKIKNRRIVEILDLLHLNEYISHQPQGLQSIVDSGGRRLPRSIIQRLLIARIIAGEPKLILLEDPLQFVASKEKKRIIDYLMNENQPWTVLVIGDIEYWGEKATQFIDLSKQ